MFSIEELFQIQKEELNNKVFRFTKIDAVKKLEINNGFEKKKNSKSQIY